MNPNVHSNTIHNSQDMEAIYMSVDRGIDKDVVRVYIWILFSHKKEQNIAIFSNMVATKDYNTKWSKSDREREIPYNITFLWLDGPEEMATPSSILTWEISQSEELGSPWGHTELDMTETT